MEEALMVCLEFKPRPHNGKPRRTHQALSAPLKTTTFYTNI